MLYQWIYPERVSQKISERDIKKFDIHPAIAKILEQRNISSSEALQRFFEPKLENLYDPFLFKDMNIAVERIIKAMRNGENIMIYGDYDVDGVTSVTILYDGLFKLGGKVSFFIPSRFQEGYGLSQDGIDAAKERQVSLIITVDCGITAVEESVYAKSLGIDVIITDHHEPGLTLPPAIAIIDPKLDTCSYPFKELAGCGVAYKVLQGLCQRLEMDPSFPEQYLDLVAVGTAADIVSLVDENRILVKNGLTILQSNPRPGIFALLEICSLIEKRISVSTIVFIIAPRINAVGRISNAKKAVHLLAAKSLQQARNIARIMEKENNARKKIDEMTFNEAQEMVENTIDIDSKRILVLAKKDWHPGVVGIVASRIMEKYNRPSILLSIQDGIGKGSARSTSNFNIYSALKHLEHLFISFGGHRYAAGITITEEDIAVLDEEINMGSEGELQIEEMVPKLNIDAEITFTQLTASFFNSIKRLSPSGPSNMRPVFVSKNLQVYGKATVVGKNHLKVKFKQDGVVVDAIGYRLGEYVKIFNKPKTRINCAYVIEEAKWSGQTTIQMKIKDFEVSDG